MFKIKHHFLRENTWQIQQLKASFFVIIREKKLHK